MAARLGSVLLLLHEAQHRVIALPDLHLDRYIVLTTSQLTVLITTCLTKSFKVEYYLIIILMLSYLTFVLFSVLTFFIRMSQFFPFK